MDSQNFKQQDFGAPYVKPTRLLFRLNHFEHKFLFPGVPKLDDQGFYWGLCLKVFPIGASLRNRVKVVSELQAPLLGPPQLCKFLAQQLQHNALLSPTAHIDFVRDTHGSVDTPHVALAQSVINPKTNLTIPSVPVDPNFWKGVLVFHALLSQLAKRRNFTMAPG